MHLALHSVSWERSKLRPRGPARACVCWGDRIHPSRKRNVPGPQAMCPGLELFWGDRDRAGGQEAAPVMDWQRGKELGPRRRGEGH